MNYNEDTPPKRSQLEEVQLELEATRQVLKAIFDSIHSSIFLVGPDYRVIFFNKWARDGSKLLYGRDLFIGDSILNYRRKGDEAIFEEFKKNFERALMTRSPVVSEREMHYPEMSFWVRSEYTPVFEYDKPIGVLLHVQNISDRKEYESKVEQQAKLLDHIAWMQSHETRQPLATLLGLIHVLDKDSLTEENKKIIRMLEDTAFKLEKVIRQTVIKANLRESGFKQDDN